MAGERVGDERKEGWHIDRVTPATAADVHPTHPTVPIRLIDSSGVPIGYAEVPNTRERPFLVICGGKVYSAQRRRDAMTNYHEETVTEATLVEPTKEQPNV